MVSSNWTGEDLASTSFIIQHASFVPVLGEDLFTVGALASSFSTKFKNYGYCSIHNVIEFWDSFGSPLATPPAGHTIVSGTNKYLQLK